MTTGPDNLELRRKRSRFRSRHRGTKEIDLLLGAFADRHLDGFGPAELDTYDALLTKDDADLFNWITGKAEPPSELQSPVLRLLMSTQLRPIND